MKAIILSAGLGTRLQPLTLERPKALVPVDGIPMLEIVIRRLKKFGFKDLVINVHHFSDHILTFLEKHNNFDLSVKISDESDCLLETGGGLMKARPFLDGPEPILVHNVDVLTNLDLNALIAHHLKHDFIATLAVKNRPTSRSLLIDRTQLLAGWKDNRTGKTIICREEEALLMPTAFSCVYVLNPKIFDLIKETGKFSIMESFLKLASTESIGTWRHDQDMWFDLGSTENIRKAEPYVKSVL